HIAVHQLDGSRIEFDQVLGRVHCLVKRREMADTQNLRAQDGRQFQRNTFAKGERAFRPDEQVREVIALRVGKERIDVIATDAANNVRKAETNFFGFARAKGQQIAEKLAVGVGFVETLQVCFDLSEAGATAVGQDGIYCQNV